jgi:hypothetical protein
VKTIRLTTTAVALAIIVAATATAAFGAASGKVVFAAKYSGNATTKIDGSNAAISATGTGLASQIGLGSIAGLGAGDTSQQPCIPFTGTGKMTGKSGTVTFKVVPGSNGCGDEGGHNFTITSKLAVVSATGKLAKAKGTLRMTGTYSHDDGSFTVKVSGTLTK